MPRLSHADITDPPPPPFSRAAHTRVLSRPPPTSRARGRTHALDLTPKRHSPCYQETGACCPIVTENQVVEQAQPDGLLNFAFQDNPTCVATFKEMLCGFACSPWQVRGALHAASSACASSSSECSGHSRHVRAAPRSCAAAIVRGRSDARAPAWARAHRVHPHAHAHARVTRLQSEHVSLGEPLTENPDPAMYGAFVPGPDGTVANLTVHLCEDFCERLYDNCRDAKLLFGETVESQLSHTELCVYLSSEVAASQPFVNYTLAPLGSSSPTPTNPWGPLQTYRVVTHAEKANGAPCWSPTRHEMEFCGAGAPPLSPPPPTPPPCDGHGSVMGEGANAHCMCEDGFGYPSIDEPLKCVEGGDFGMGDLGGDDHDHDHHGHHDHDHDHDHDKEGEDGAGAGTSPASTICAPVVAASAAAMAVAAALA